MLSFRRWLQAAASAAAALCAIQTPAQAALVGLQPLASPAAATFFYKGAGCTGLAALPQFEKFIGRKVDGVADFVSYNSWSDMQSALNWGLGCWQGHGYKLSLGMPMFPNGTVNGLQNEAAGAYNAQFVQLANTLVSHGFGDAYIRVGWEFNGNWYPWTAANSPTQWAQSYRQIVMAMRSVPGAKFKFVWNPALYPQNVTPSQAYPGDDVVDVIATDAYNVSWDAGYLNTYSRWNSVDNDPWGVAQLVSFAAAHKKPVAFPEWGTGTRSDGHGGGDDPVFINNMANIIKQNNVAYQSYWDYPASDYNAQLSNGQYPNAAAAFLKNFGTLSLPTLKGNPGIVRLPPGM